MNEEIKVKFKEDCQWKINYNFIKRVTDIVLSLLGITILSPIILIVTILIKIESEG